MELILARFGRGAKETALSAALLVLFVGPLSAEPPARAVTISPDARYVAWVSGSDIWLASIAKESNQPRRIAKGNCLAWSPDSRKLAFVSDIGAKGRQQVYTV